MSGDTKIFDIIVGAIIGSSLTVLCGIALFHYQAKKESTTKIKEKEFSIYEELKRNQNFVHTIVSITQDFVPLETATWESSKDIWHRINFTSRTKKFIESSYSLVKIYNAELFHTDRNKKDIENNLKYLDNILTKTLKMIDDEKKR